MRAESLSVRFLRKVRVSDGCWLWTGAIQGAGYGNIGVGRSTQPAHRVAWMLSNGEIPDGMCVCHHCDVRACVRPSHLFLGTNLDNTRDRDRKGRNVNKVGAAHGSAKLTDEQVKAIHADTRKQDDIAASYGISQSTVHRIKARANGGWKHLPLAEKRTFRRRV